VILDEANVAARYGLITTQELLELMALKPNKVELVITGRYADERVMQAADLVTEMREIKHYGKQGVIARRGIEKKNPLRLYDGRLRGCGRKQRRCRCPVRVRSRSRRRSTTWRFRFRIAAVLSLEFGVRSSEWKAEAVLQRHPSLKMLAMTRTSRMVRR
jgi:hypothetical protein